jgi:hypothetical protein
MREDTWPDEGRREQNRSCGQGEVARETNCLVADRKVWPDARTGAKGQRPTHGRAGAGLASPAGTGADAPIVLAHRFRIDPFCGDALFFDQQQEYRKI